MAALWSAVLMLEQLGKSDVAAQLMCALEDVARDGPRAREVGGTASTSEVGDAVVARLLG
jgi:tartrate dehydrogenase/decarboxylase/D-malate dehydrogenase